MKQRNSNHIIASILHVRKSELYASFCPTYKIHCYLGLSSLNYKKCYHRITEDIKCTSTSEGALRCLRNTPRNIQEVLKNVDVEFKESEGAGEAGVEFVRFLQ